MNKPVETPPASLKPEIEHLCKAFLSEARRVAGVNASKRLNLATVNKRLGLNRAEIRSVVEHLAERGLLVAETIGGPLLYGHVRLVGKQRARQAHGSRPAH